MLKEMRAANRAEEFKEVMRFISECSLVETARIIEEIRCCHDNIFVWHKEMCTLDKVNSVCLNGETIQLNLGDCVITAG